MTCLHLASAADRTDVVGCLIRRGAKLEEKDFVRKFALLGVSVWTFYHTLTLFLVRMEILL
eukprot:m.283716 g.283716  ORF g.283716 m.283716 type:complete len:61 (+) comp40672_c0_seq11:1-183(+)